MQYFLQEERDRTGYTQFITAFPTVFDHDPALRVVRSASFRTAPARLLTEAGRGCVCFPS